MLLTLNVPQGTIEAALLIAMLISSYSILKSDNSILTIQWYLDASHVVNALAILEPRYYG
jgi:hypothetical protein